MRPADEVLRDLVRQWVAKAELDYQAAGQLLGAEKPLPEIIAFHCQQAVEKYLKGLLVRSQIEFPKTHSIGQLLDLLSTVQPQAAATLRDANILSPYGVEIRYPGDFPEVPRGEEQRLFEIAGLVRQTVKELLKPY